MANKSIRDRIKVTKNGKTKRRSQGLGHNRSKWNTNQKGRKKEDKDLGIKDNDLKDVLNN